MRSTILSVVIFVAFSILAGVGFILFVQGTDSGAIGATLYMSFTLIVFLTGQNLWQRKWPKHQSGGKR